MSMTSSRILMKHWKAHDMLVIGLVNNMPAAAIPATERQFCDLLTLAAREIPVHIRWFRLVGARPSHYERLEDLWASDLDGLIVTGAEPRAASLPDEPFWPPLTEIVAWAAQRTSSVIWSCLAAHAAVLYLDGVERRRHQDKFFGVFSSVKAAEHAILANIPSVWRVPHSRWNDLLEEHLVAGGYEVLARSHGAGVDLFVKQRQRSLFLFMQSHPEYAPNALMREYRRDIARFCAGQQDRYPNVPCNYFDIQTSAELESIRVDTLSNGSPRDLQVLEHAALPSDWREMAVQFYRNWLSYLLAARTAPQAAMAFS